MIRKKGVIMLDEILKIFFDQLNIYGIHFLGTFLVATAFGVFYGKNTQYARFAAISRGFWVLAFKYLILVLLPCLEPLNPAFVLPVDIFDGLSALLTAVAAGFFLTSLFPMLIRLSSFVVISIVFTLCVLGANYGFLLLNIKYLLPTSIPFLTLGISLMVAALGFHAIPTITQKSIFTIPRLGLLAIGVYFILHAFNLIIAGPIVPVILYGIVAVSVLIAQLRFTQLTVLSTERALEKEKKKKTLFWDVAPFPILLAKLMDDSVVYMNPACQTLLGLTPEQMNHFHFSNYFTKPEKREELIQQTKTNHVVEGFEVELKSPESEKSLWITLSSRVFELDGELVLYINFTNITEQKETEQELFIQASTDTLTGLNNRRQFFALTQQAFAVAARDHKAYSVVMLDIDHFKAINDTYGHDAGDEVLKHLAQVMTNTLRKADIIARWGGEEFIVFLLSDPSKAVIPANKLREAVEATTVIVGDQQIKFTISLGISVSQVQDVAALQKEADLALYHSKENGRNQVTLFAPEFANMPTDLESDR